MTKKDPPSKPPKTFVMLGKLGSEIFGIDTVSKHVNRLEVNDRTAISKVRAFQTARTAGSESHHSQDLARPELLFVQTFTSTGNSIAKHKLKHLLELNSISPTTQILGQRGPSIPYASLDGNCSSVALIKVGNKLILERNQKANKIYATFPFGPVIQSFPILDARATSTFPPELEKIEKRSDIAAHLGFAPSYILLALARVHHGYCKKVVVALLPEP